MWVHEAVPARLVQNHSDDASGSLAVQEASAMGTKVRTGKACALALNREREWGCVPFVARIGRSAGRPHAMGCATLDCAVLSH